MTQAYLNWRSQSDTPWLATGSFIPRDKSSVEGKVESSLTSVYPYFGYELGENNAFWGIFGLGEGDLKVSEKDQTLKTDASMRMGAVGAKGPILSQREGNGMDMTLQTDGLYVRMNSDATKGMESAETEVTRLRLMLDSSKSFKVGKGVLTPSFRMGARHDSGDAEEGVGLEAGGTVRYVAGGLTIEGSLRKLLAHEDSGYKEWGASTALKIDPGQSERGLSLSIFRSWGDHSSDVDRLWDVKGANQFRSGDLKAESRLEAEIGYGIWNPFKKLFGVLTPYFGFSGGDSDRSYRTGTRWKISPNSNLGLKLSHTEGKEKGTDDKAIMLEGTFRW